MPALNFQSRFAPLVESGEKRQTIRAPRKRPIRVGDTLYLYTGMRTKACRKLGEAVCGSVSPVRMFRPGGGFCLTVDGKNPAGQANAIAVADGFPNAIAMIDWFEETHGLPFDGLLIRW